jgi:iron complex transport system ATP-binding protein
MRVTWVYRSLLSPSIPFCRILIIEKSMTVTALDVKHLTWQVQQRTILQNINFSVDSGEIVGIVGPNGAGKTSLLKCLYQENFTETSQIKIFDNAIADFDQKTIAQSIAVVTQLHEPIFDLTVFDLVRMGLIPYKNYFERDSEDDLQLIDSALTKVDLVDKKAQPFNTLSGGEQQRCLIARAIVQRPKILIMDEPTNHLDVFYQHQILTLVTQLDLTLIITIHDLNLAAQYCNKLLLINQGQLVHFDKPKAVLTEPILSEVFNLPCIVDKNPYTHQPRVTFAASTKRGVKC